MPPLRAPTTRSVPEIVCAKLAFAPLRTFSTPSSRTTLTAIATTVSNEVDTLTPIPANPEIGYMTQRYFLLETILRSDITLTLRTSGDLVVELLTTTNQLIAAGVGTVSGLDLGAARYIVRVRPADGAALQQSTFDIDVDIRIP